MQIFASSHSDIAVLMATVTCDSSRLFKAHIQSLKVSNFRFIRSLKRYPVSFIAIAYSIYEVRTRQRVESSVHIPWIEDHSPSGSSTTRSSISTNPTSPRYFDILLDVSRSMPTLEKMVPAHWSTRNRYDPGDFIAKSSSWHSRA